VALLFTWMSVDQARTELGIAEQGQITNRFNAAVQNLGSESIDVRLGGIYALQRIMRDSSRDQPAIVSILSAYVRQNAPVPAKGFDEVNEDDLFWGRASTRSDLQAVLTVLSDRSPEHDGYVSPDLSKSELRNAGLSGPFESTNLTDSDLRGASLSGDLRKADLSKANLASARLDEANLTGAWFQETNLQRAVLWGAKLTGATFTDADLREAQVSEGDPATNLSEANFFGADLSNALLDGANLTDAIFVEANLSRAELVGANMRGARLSAADKQLEDILGSVLDSTAHATLRGANLTKANLIKADLRGVDLRDANLTGADLRGAKLSGVKLAGAKTTGVRGLPQSLH
jgi:uncharacterized protein YjbI with pentapeptide repeats